MAERLVGFDAGNSEIKAVNDQGKEVKFPHFLIQLGARSVADIELREGTDDLDIYRVNSTYYAVGKRAIREGDGSVRYGEERYVRDYYGVLGAIALFKLFDQNESNIFVYGSHTPKDLAFRPDLISSIKGKWTVENQGVSRRFNVVDAKGADEPVMAYRHATLSDDGRSMRGEEKLKRGVVLVIDWGGFTVALSTAEKGLVDYDSGRSYQNGLIDVRTDLEQLIRRNNRLILKGANFLDPIELDKALISGEYDAKMMGVINCRNEVNAVLNPLLTVIRNHISNYGGLSQFDCILLAGGGGALMEKRLREALPKATIYIAEQDRAKIQFSTARGMIKVLRAISAKGATYR